MAIKKSRKKPMGGKRPGAGRPITTGKTTTFVGFCLPIAHAEEWKAEIKDLIIKLKLKAAGTQVIHTEKSAVHVETPWGTIKEQDKTHKPVLNSFMEKRRKQKQGLKE